MSLQPPPTSIQRLGNPPQALPFIGLTFPTYQATLLNLSSDHTRLAFGATQDGKPVGLLLIGLDEQSAEIESLVVLPDFRNQGIATALLQAAEQELLDRGILYFDIIYTTGKDTTPALEHALERSGFGPPVPRLYLFQAGPECIDSLIQARWMRRGALPTGFTFFPWADLSEAEREQIERGLVDGSIPGYVNPFIDSELMEPAYSFGLHHDGAVVGWMIGHRNEVGLVRYTSLYVREKLPVAGLGLHLVVEAVHRLINKEAQRPGGGVCWGAPVDVPWADFLRRRIVRDLPGVKTSLTVSRTRVLPVQQPV